MDAKPPLTAQVQHSSGSFELVLSAVILGLIGLFIDRQVGTTPVFTVVLTVAGFVGATLSVYYRYRHRIAQLQAETAEFERAARAPRSAQAAESAEVAAR